MNISQNREKYKRTNFLKDDIIGGKDLSSMNFFRLFPNNFDPVICIIDDSLVGRPDLISKKYFDAVEYWWIILKYNHINDPFNELGLNTILKIPNIRDIHGFYSNFVLNRK